MYHPLAGHIPHTLRGNGLRLHEGLPGINSIEARDVLKTVPE